MYRQLDQTESLLTIRMARPKANTLNSQMLEDLRTAFGTAANDAGVRGVVLASAVPGIFSAGFNAREIFPFGAAEIKVFFGGFLQLIHAILELPKPVVAAIDGHAIAGGAILALGCDARVMSEGEYGFAINEINLGLVISMGLLQMAVAAVGSSAARELILEGATISPQRAHPIGLAGELAPAGQAAARAEARARKLMEKPPLAFAAVKRLFRETLVPAAGREGPSLDTFVAHWISEESRERRAKLAASFGRG
jgi:Delta3-Delta2-enoyl-CoA isomerase